MLIIMLNINEDGIRPMERTHIIVLCKLSLKGKT